MNALKSGSKPLLEDSCKLESDNVDSTQPSNERSYWSKVRLVSIPSSIDVLATGMGRIGMIYVPASVWQMLRGATIIFTACFSVVFLRKRMCCYNWFGIGLCIVGVVVVGSASVLGGGASVSSSSEAAEASSAVQHQTSVALGVVILLLAQVLQAAQMVLEEWLMKSVKLPGLQIIGWEGTWGFLILLLVIHPLVWIMPGSDNGHVEDPFDTVAMLRSSASLVAIVLVYTFSVAAYNVAGICVTGALSALHRVLIEACRTVVVWSFGLFVHYGIDSTSPFGEVWTHYSYLQLIGFVLLLMGQSTYGGLLRWPCFAYPAAKDRGLEEWKSPSAAINLVGSSPPSAGPAKNLAT